MSFVPNQRCERSSSGFLRVVMAGSRGRAASAPRRSSRTGPCDVLLYRRVGLYGRRSIPRRPAATRRPLAPVRRRAILAPSAIVGARRSPRSDLGGRPMLEPPCRLAHSLRHRVRAAHCWRSACCVATRRRRARRRRNRRGRQRSPARRAAPTPTSFFERHRQGHARAPCPTRAAPRRSARSAKARASSSATTG